MLSISGRRVQLRVVVAHEDVVPDQLYRIESLYHLTVVAEELTQLFQQIPTALNEAATHQSQH